LGAQVSSAGLFLRGAKPLTGDLKHRKNGAPDVRESLGKLRSEQSGDVVEANKVLDC
jgi:hypothetical protein